MPECILGIKMTILKHCVFYVLERVLAFQCHVFERDILRAHHKIFALRSGIIHFNVFHRPAKLRRHDVTTANHHVAALAKRLDTVHLCICDRNMVCIPERGAAQRRHFRVVNLQTMHMPERIAQVKKASVYLYVRRLLDRTFPIRRAVEGAVVYDNALASI